MAQAITGVTLTAPASDPAVGTGSTFTMSATYTQAGHGGEETVSLHWQWSLVSGGPYTDIPSTGITLSTPTNPTTGTDSTVTHSATITADGAGTYYVHVRAVGDTSTTAFESGNQVVTASAGAQTITGAAYNDADTFGASTVVAGAVSVTGAAFTDADTFGASSFAATYAITGASFADADVFGTNTAVAGAVTITGAAFADADTFGNNAIATAGGAQTITGAAYADADSFGAATVAATYAVSAVAFADADTFGVSSFSASYAISGAVFEDADTFGANAIMQAGAQVITGAVFVDADSFGSSSIGPAQLTPRGDDAPGMFNTSGASRRYFYEKQIEELEDIAQSVAPPRKLARKVRKALEPLRALDVSAVPVETALREQGNDFAAFQQELAAYLLSVGQELERVAKRKRKNAVLALLLEAA